VACEVDNLVMARPRHAQLRVIARDAKVVDDDVIVVLPADQRRSSSCGLAKPKGCGGKWEVEQALTIVPPERLIFLILPRPTAGGNSARRSGGRFLASDCRPT
jgi:hypothetical protein